MKTGKVITLCLALSTLSYSTGAFSGCEPEQLPLRTQRHSVPVVACAGNFTLEDAAEAGAKSIVIVAAESVAAPAAIKIASLTGVTAGTGTPIAALSGAAATRATLAAVGGPASAALGVVGIAASPVVVGGILVAGLGTAIGYGINWLIFD